MSLRGSFSSKPPDRLLALVCSWPYQSALCIQPCDRSPCRLLNSQHNLKVQNLKSLLRLKAIYCNPHKVLKKITYFHHTMILKNILPFQKWGMGTYWGNTQPKQEWSQAEQTPNPVAFYNFIQWPISDSTQGARHTLGLMNSLAQRKTLQSLYSCILHDSKAIAI